MEQQFYHIDKLFWEQVYQNEYACLCSTVMSLGYKTDGFGTFSEFPIPPLQTQTYQNQQLKIANYNWKGCILLKQTAKFGSPFIIFIIKLICNLYKPVSATDFVFTAQKLTGSRTLH